MLPPATAWTPPDGIVIADGGADALGLGAGRPRPQCPTTPRSSSCTTRRARLHRARCSRQSSLRSAPDADAAIPALAVVDTVKRIDGNRVIDTVPRDDLVVVQTPQAFRAAPLRAAHAGDAVGTDDAALVEAGGGTVVVVPGETRNLKLTVAADLELAQALLDTGSGA